MNFVKQQPRGSDAVRFLAKCIYLNGHLIWRGGVQFRIGAVRGSRCTSPTQAAYVIREGIDRIPDGHEVARTCPRQGCVLHVGLFPAGSIGRAAGKERTLLTDAEVLWVRGLPKLTRLPVRARAAAKERIMEALGHRVSWSYIQDLRVPSSPLRRGLWPKGGKRA